MANKEKLNLKLSVIGDEFTGKTSLICRYTENTFSDDYKTTLGANFIEKKYAQKDLKIINENHKISLTIWDMAGQDHFEDIVKIYVDGSNGVFIVFDLSNKKSFEGLDLWYNQTLKLCPEAEIFFVGNKSDLEQKISKEELEALKNEKGFEIIFTSAKDDINVDNIFEKMVEKIYLKAIENARI